ncbi:MAG: glycosyltransferase [Flavobacteriaceae bacterium]
MKILCVIDSLGSGGAQRQLVNLAIGFKEEGHEVSFLVYHRINFFKEILDKNNIPIHEILETNYLKRLLKMRRYIRQGEFDSILSFLEAANFICEIAGLPSRKWKLVVGERSANPEILKSLELRVYRWFHFLADYVVANSHENLKMVYKINPFLPLSKGKVIYNMIDLDQWKPLNDYIYFKDNRFNLIVPASFGDVKNLYGLIKGVTLLPENYREKIQIKWYGNDHRAGFLSEARKKIQSLKINGSFLFYPPTHDIIKHMQEADAVGLFSFYEGLPNAICEGMSLGKTVISTKISDLPLLLKNPDLLADPSSPESIAATLKYYMDLSEVELVKEGEYNRKKAEELFNKSEILNQYISILK